MRAALLQRVEQAMGAAVQEHHAVSGGCIADARCVRLVDGRSCFIKSMDGGQQPFLQEAHGLRELAKGGALRIPQVLHVEEDLLILEWLGQGRPKDGFMEILGRGLAQLHRVPSTAFGFYEDNFLGASPQLNTPQETGMSWATFYWEKRLFPQWQWAEQKGLATADLRRLMGRLEDRLEGLLAGSEEAPALLHGDLWSGNVMADAQGAPCLIDPAVYYGHREAELGMTSLFGGFGSAFYRAYEEAFPLPDGHLERRGLYELYHVLNHLNLFGSGYLGQAVQLLRRYVG
ncbi:MAG: fructosamine kinase family protein [Myxococcales bacterium]|nr:fructosamine kinase family protein [Myxococcales bacterium]